MSNDKKPHFNEEQGATEDQTEKIDAIVGDQALGYDGAARGEHSGQESGHDEPANEGPVDDLADNRPDQMR